MRKLGTLLAFLLLLTPNLFGQSLSIDNPPSATMYESNVMIDDVNFNLVIRNNSSDAKSIKVKMIPEKLADGHDAVMCWTFCYAPGVMESPKAEVVPGNSTISKFFGYIYPNGKPGTSVIRYVFYDINNPSDSLSFRMTYNIGMSSSVKEFEGNLVSASLSVPYPSPADGSTTVDYAFSGNTAGQLALYNALGVQLHTYPLSSPRGTVSLETASLPNGIYFYAITAGGKKIVTQKVVIRH